MGLTGPTIAAALAFSLSVIALVSLAWFHFSAQDATVTTTARSVRVFKREVKAIPVEVHSRSPRWARLSLSSIQGGQVGLDCELRANDGGQSWELLLKAAYAGRSDDLVANFQVTDPLELFARKISVHLDLTFESLPLGLRTEPVPMLIHGLSYGDVPSGKRGQGLELYAIGRYHQDMDTRDIMWKKAASMTDGSLPVREREGSVKRNVSVMVAVECGRESDRPRTNDLAAEVVAQIGRQVLSAGSALELVLPRTPGRPPSKVTASDLPQLANATLMPLAYEHIETVPVGGTPPDLLVVNEDELARDSMKPSLGRFGKIIILASGEGGAKDHGHSPDVTVFSGTEDLSGAIAMVLVR